MRRFWILRDSPFYQHHCKAVENGDTARAMWLEQRERWRLRLLDTMREALEQDSSPTVRRIAYANLSNKYLYNYPREAA